MKARFTMSKMQGARPVRKHSNVVVVRNLAARILAARAVPPTIEQIRQEGIKLAFSLTA